MKEVKLCQLSGLGYTYESVNSSDPNFKYDIMIFKNGEAVHPYLEGFYVVARDSQNVIGNYTWKVK